MPRKLGDGNGGGITLKNQAKTATKNGTYTPDVGYTGLSSVTVKVPEPEIEALEITKNGTYTAEDVDGYAPITVNVPTGGSGTTIKNQNKTITEHGQYTATSGYTGLGTVTVAVPACTLSA